MSLLIYFIVGETQGRVTQRLARTWVYTASLKNPIPFQRIDKTNKKDFEFLG